MSHCLNMLTCTTRGSNVFSTLRVLISRLLGSQLSTVWAWLKLPLACNEVSMIENCLFLALSLESAPTKNDEKNYCLWTLLLKRFSSLKSFPGKKWLHEFSTFFRKKRWICWSKRDYGWSTNILLDQVYSNECPLSTLTEIEVILWKEAAARGDVDKLHKMASASINFSLKRPM